LSNEWRQGIVSFLTSNVLLIEKKGRSRMMLSDENNKLSGRAAGAEPLWRRRAARVHPGICVRCRYGAAAPTAAPPPGFPHWPVRNDQHDKSL
jgi:hypothetical protein